jgi:hypothetical protein
MSIEIEKVPRIFKKYFSAVFPESISKSIFYAENFIWQDVKRV